MLLLLRVPPLWTAIFSAGCLAVSVAAYESLMLRRWCIAGRTGKLRSGGGGRRVGKRATWWRLLQMRSVDFYGNRWILVPFPKSNVEMEPVEFSIRLVRVRTAGKLSQEFRLLRFNLFSAIDI